MPAGMKTRPLSRYLKDFKLSQSHCAQCGKKLDRMALVFRGHIVNKVAIARLDQPINDEIWHNLIPDLTALCRFCSEISCHKPSAYFDIMAFKQYLFQQTEMNHSTVREYVVRLRRLDEMLVANDYPVDRLSEDAVHQQIIADLPIAGHNNYRIALRKYDQYLRWERGGSTEDS